MGWQEDSKRHKLNFQALMDNDKVAKKNKQLVGRYIDHPYADGNAYYLIVKENKSTVRIKVCTGLGDDWVLPAWGEETTIKKADALKFIASRESLAKLFG